MLLAVFLPAIAGFVAVDTSTHYWLRFWNKSIPQAIIAVISAATESHKPRVAKEIAIAVKRIVVIRQLDRSGLRLPLIEGIKAMANPKHAIIITTSCQIT